MSADLEAFGLSTRDRVTSRQDHPLRLLSERIARVLDVGEFELYVHRVRNRGVAVELSNPPMTARAMGAETFAVTTSPEKEKRIEALADHVIVARDPERLAEEVERLTDGRGVDLAFDPVGFDYSRALMRSAAVDGQVVVYGLLSGTEAPLDLRTMIFKDLGVQGFTVHRLLRDPGLLEEAVATVLELAERGAIRPLIAAEYGFEEAPEALAAMARNEHIGKIVLRVE